MARLGIEASAPPPASSESADTAADALQSQAAATPVGSESGGTARTESLSWSTSPVATSAGSGAVSSSQAQPALPPSVDMSLPIKPHWVSLESGAVQVEVLRMARDGGGQVTLELTPPDQGRYRLDLRIDDFGHASLVVEGASESMRTRLEMGESSLREQFAQMGLQLSLQMRSQQGQPDPGQADSSSPAWNAGADPAGGPLQSNSAPRRTVALDLERSLVRLYA
jgi:flagellar hook-length control protein FliK